MSGTPSPATGRAAPSREGRAAIHALAAWVRDGGDGLARELAGRIHERVAGLEDDLYPATVASCRANVGSISSLLEDDLPPHMGAVPPEAAFYARELARRQIGLDGLLQAYRVAHGLFMRMALEQLESRDLTRETLAQTAAFFSDWLFDWMDDVLGRVTREWMLEREQWVRTSAAIRAESVAAVLAGHAIDTPEVSSRLGYDLELRHVAFIVWADADADDGPAGARDFEAVAAEVVGRLGATSSLLVAQGSARLDGWAAVPDAATGALEARLPAAAAAGARVAVGAPARGVAGFRQGHDDALAVQRLATLSRRPPGACVRFEDVVLDTLLTRDRSAAERFVRMQLGDLHADDDATRRLAATLRVHLEEGGSHTRAARRIGVHENTVAYRVRRAEELLGRPVAAAKLEIHVALRLADLLRTG